MAASDQIKSLIKSFGDGDEDRFFASAMQIAASEARQGHSNFAQELKALIESARKNRSSVIFEKGKIVSMPTQKREINELIEVFQPRIKLSNMVLDANVSKVLLQLVDEQKHWELLRQNNLSPLRKILLMGAPGTGKTMTAHAIAGELNIPVFIVRLDGLLSKFMGESIAKLRVIFDMMTSQRAVYLFDEFDSIGSHRNQGQDVGEIKRVLNSFLINIEKDTSNSIIIAATNLPDSLDVALFRRFDNIIRYPIPNEQEISAAIKKYTTGHSFDIRPNFKMVAKELISLNYSDISRAAEETIKDKILKGSPKLNTKFLVQALKNKMP